MSISQFFILSSRGDSIIFRDFRKDIKVRTNEAFLRKATFWDNNEETAPPFFNIEGINYIYVRKFDLYFVMTSKDNFSPSYFTERLDRLMIIIKDHCGLISEESIRKNFILIYEIIDEMIDFGIPQLSSTEQVKPFVFTDPILVSKAKPPSTGLFGNKSHITSLAVQEPLSQNTEQKKKNQIFVDLFEKITLLFNSKGNIINSAIDGCIQMKSYLKSNPELMLMLNDDLVVGRSNYSSSLPIDDAIFHSCVGLKLFENSKTLSLVPPEGEFIVMNYRISKDFTPPFNIISSIEESNYKIELKIRIQANFSDKFHAANVLVKFRVPKVTQTVRIEVIQGQPMDYADKEKTCYWKINKFVGGSEETLTAKITLPSQKVEDVRKELGPISLNFEIPNFNISKIKIKELKIIASDNNYEALRWVRHVTQASSYVARIN